MGHGRFASAARPHRQKIFSAIEAVRSDARCAVMVAMRADFYGDLMGSPLWPLLPEQRVEIAPLASEALKEAIRRPAEKERVIVAADLIERLTADSNDQPGSLPFLQETLRSLWGTAVGRGDRLLQAADYENLSRDGRTGLELAVAAKADAVLSALPSAPRFNAERQRAIVQRTLIRLIQFGDRVTRRQQRWDDLRGAGDDAEEFDATLHYLADQRIITTGEDRVVDLSHEALISGWKTLQDWIAAAESAEQVRRYYEGVARNWERLGRGEPGLLDDGEVAELDRWRSRGSEFAVTPLLERLIDSRMNSFIPPAECRQLAFDPSGDRLACGTVDDGTLLWDMDAGAKPRNLHIPGLHDLVFSPDSQWLAGSRAALMQLIPLENPSSVVSLRGHTKEVTGLAFSPDGSVLASSSHDGTIRLWPRLHTEEENWYLATGVGHSLEFLDHEHLLWTGRHRLNVLDLSVQRMADRICKVVGRNLTEDEWKTALSDRDREVTCAGLPLP